MSEEGKGMFGRRRKPPAGAGATQAAGGATSGGQKPPKNPPKPSPIVPKTPLPSDPTRKSKPATPLPNSIIRALGKRGRWPNLPKG